MVNSSEGSSQRPDISPIVAGEEVWWHRSRIEGSWPTMPGHLLNQWPQTLPALPSLGVVPAIMGGEKAKERARDDYRQNVARHKDTNRDKEQLLGGPMRGARDMKGFGDFKLRSKAPGQAPAHSSGGRFRPANQPSVQTHAPVRQPVPSQAQTAPMGQVGPNNCVPSKAPASAKVPVSARPTGMRPGAQLGPNQNRRRWCFGRHSRGTDVRRQCGLKASRVSLRHARLKATEIYAETNLELAIKVVREMG